MQVMHHTAVALLFLQINNHMVLTQYHKDFIKPPNAQTERLEAVQCRAINIFLISLLLLLILPHRHWLAFHLFR